MKDADHTSYGSIHGWHYLPERHSLACIMVVLGVVIQPGRSALPLGPRGDLWPQVFAVLFVLPHLSVVQSAQSLPEIAESAGWMRIVLNSPTNGAFQSK